MRTPSMRWKSAMGTALLGSAFTLSGCLLGSHPDQKLAVNNALDKNNLLSVTVKQDRRSGVMTLNGIVGEDTEKVQAETLARQAAPAYTISDQIQVQSSGLQSMINDAGSNTDKAIDNNYKDSLAQHKSLQDANIQYTTENGTVTLKGSVKTAAQKKEAEDLAKKIPQVQNVVNELEVTPNAHKPANS